MQRAIGLRGAVAVNIITMVGIGPLITIPLVLSAMNGPLALIGWIAGALVALCDGLVWAELGSRYPGSGGTYVFLREIFGPQKWGRFFAFLFNWQFLLYAPCLLASGYIGFAGYATYLFPQIGSSWWLQHGLEAGIGLLTIALLYRRTGRVAQLGMAFAVCAVATLVLVIVAAAPHVDLHQAFALSGPVRFDWGFLAGFGGALFVTLYDYVGYADAALLGDEVREPNRTIPLAIVISIAIVTLLYICLQIGVLGVVPWQSLVGIKGAAPPADAQFVASTLVAKAWGYWPAIVVTVLVLVTAFASVYGNLLGFSRIPFAAARDGEFPAIFARLHPTKDFPYVALLVIGGLSILACAFTLDQVIAFLTAGIVLVQAVLQIVAVVLLRTRKERAPFRMPLFPLPVIIALGGWLLAFIYTGTTAIVLGIGWLAIGAIVFFITASHKRWWPFAAVALLALFLPAHASAADSWKTWNTSKIVALDGYPAFSIDGKPTFVSGAAFFYERMPSTDWRQALANYSAAGFDTIDVYVPWNWHELSDDVFDFNGKTNPSRDLRGLLQAAHDRRMHVILRPGPVIRNEWRNGGYPAWLLQRPEYAMPLHDVLEGRYPPTATLQNAHADAAAEEWLHNSTHLRYASRWLRRVLHTVEPWSSDIVAIALDDDQGAYIDNDTWPAPHWHAYMAKLARIVRSVVGERVPLFINTYQMKVTASAPVWAWGNWYQSDAYSIGDHDLAQLAFSTALLQTQPGKPVMVSEFQAGWLQNADEVAPRPADPGNTALALHEMFQLGAKGIVDFPPQDTLTPAGWEAPWSNRLYRWDAAFDVGQLHSTRFAPTRQAYTFFRTYRDYLGTLHPKVDAAIAWMPSAYDSVWMTNARIYRIAAQTIVLQQRCRTLSLTCSFIDLRYASAAALKRVHVLIVPPLGLPYRYVDAAERNLERFRAGGGRVVADADVARSMVAPANGGILDSALLVSADGRSGVLDVINQSAEVRSIGTTRLDLGHRFVTLPHFVVLPRTGADMFLGTSPHPQVFSQIGAGRDTAHHLPLAPGAILNCSAGRYFKHPDEAYASKSNDLCDGTATYTLRNDDAHAIVSADAGAESIYFGNLDDAENVFTTIGALRDDVQAPPTPSPRDYIAKYTHPIETGTFNRSYACVPST
ncbi:MAG: amino acid permease, partial [Candidatus Eremiobacteraeota bacterium]|nr:amino acid permease [Candidatus Eremiobacteraeota bacterium]